MEMKLLWKPDSCNAYLVAEKQAKLRQPIFARVYIKNDFDGFQGWMTQIYTSSLWKDSTDRRSEKPMGLSGSQYATFKQARKAAEKHTISWFQSMGITVTIETPEFEKEKLWDMKKQTSKSSAS